MAEETIGGRFKSCVKEYGNVPMIRYYRDGSWRDLSWREFDRKVQKLGAAMISLGIDPGDRIAVYSKNCPEWQLMDFATLSIGAANVSLYQTLTASQVEFILSDSGSRIIFVGERSQLEHVLEVYDDLPGLFKIVTMNNITYDHPDVITFDQVLELGEETMDPDLLTGRLEKCGAHDLCTIIYTSGTTGNPKGVMLTHDNLLSNVRALSTLAEVNVGDVILSILPLSHSFERTAGYYLPLFKGVTIAHARSMDEINEDLVTIKPNFMVSVPRLFEKVHTRVLSGVEEESKFNQRMFWWGVNTGREVSKLKVAKKPLPFFLGLKFNIAKKLIYSKVYEKIGGRVRFFVSGGAPLAKEISEFFHAMDILILEGYGLTETAPVLTVNRDTNFKFGTVGPPIPDVEIKIADDGEILARGPNIMTGYYNQSAATAEVIDPEGWFHTGDVGYLDEDGFLHITDRKKDLIVTAGGKNIAPQNIEGALIIDRYIDQVCVIGDRRKFVCALIVPDFQELEQWAREQGIAVDDRKDLVTNEKIVGFLNERIERHQLDFAKYEKVKKYLLLSEELTEEAGFVTPSLKIKRREIEAAFKAEIDRLYAEETDPGFIPG